jgi:hypothetical protein
MNKTGFCRPKFQCNAMILIPLYRGLFIDSENSTDLKSEFFLSCLNMLYTYVTLLLASFLLYPPRSTGLGTEFCSEKIPRNRLGTVSIIPRKKVLIPRHSKFRGRPSSEAQNGTHGMEIRGKNEF